VVDVSNGTESLGAVTADAAGHFTFTLPAGTTANDIVLTAMPVEDNYRGDMLSVNAARSNAHFVWASDNSYVTMTLDRAGGGVSTTILRDVESVKFTGGASAETVRIVGAGGYASVQDASNAHGGSFATSNIVFAPLTLNANNDITGNVVEDSTSAVVGLANTVSGNLNANVASVLVNGQANAASYGVVNLGSIGSILVSEYGTLTIDNQGHWQYDLIASKTALQALGAGAHHNDFFTIRVKDSQGGFIDQQITIDIVGTNDAAGIGNAMVVEVKEDTSLVGADLVATGTLTVTDVDTVGVVSGGENHFKTTVTAVTTDNLGSLTIDANGVYRYTVANALVDTMAEGDKRVETFSVQSIDGTPKLLSFTISGTNDAPTVTAGSQSVTLVEAGGVANGTVGTSSATIALTMGDVDGTANYDATYLTANGWATSNTGATYTKVGTYGTATLTVSTGVVSYALNNSSAATQALTGGQSVTDSFTVQVTDGAATSNVAAVFAITGTNDAPVIGTHTNVTIIQGLEGVQVIDKFNAVDPEGDTVAFSLTGTNSNLFVIDSNGQITLTAEGSAYVASQVGTEGATGDVVFNLTVNATDGSASSSQAVTITVDMAQKSSTAASLPGSISDWSIASNGAGFVLTDLSSLTTATPVQVSLSSSVTNLTFSDGTINLVDGTAGAADRITIGSGFADVKLTLAPSSDNTLIVLNDAHVGSGHSEVTGGAGTDTVRIVSTMNMADLASFSIDGGWLKVTSQTGITWMKDVESLEFANTDGTVHTTVRIVGASGYESLSAATANANAGDVIYVSDLSLAVNQEIATSNQISIFVAGTSPGTTINLTAAATAASINVDMYGSHNYALVGSSGADTIHDFSTANAVSLSGMDGDDKIVVHTSDASHAANVLGGAGADILIGGAGAVISGGDGNDKLLAYGAALLTGGAGDDILFNSSTAANAVVMTGGSGSDTFALIGGANANATGSMNTVIADLGTGDKINLSYLERAGLDTSIDTTANFTGAGGTATQSTAGTKLLFGANIIATSSQDELGDINSAVLGGTMNVSNATLTKTSAAINAGREATSEIDFVSTFGHNLTDTYNHHG
jgi:VCBS repeat-containing protein